MPCDWAVVVFYLILLYPGVFSDLVVDVVCVAPSVFPVSAYDSILQRISGNTLKAATTFRSDSITGAEALRLYFPNNTSIVRFQLLHITRVHSVLPTLSAGDYVTTVHRLQTELINVTAVYVGMCGIDKIVDTDNPTISSVVSSKEWFDGLPALLGPVALIGWILTLVAFGLCWVYYCCVNRSVIPVAESVEPHIQVVSNSIPAAVVVQDQVKPPVLLPSLNVVPPPPPPIINPVVKTPSVPISIVPPGNLPASESSLHKVEPTRVTPASNMSRERRSVDYVPPPPRTRRQRTRQAVDAIGSEQSRSIEFRASEPFRSINMRLPSFEAHRVNPATQPTLSSNQASYLHF
jgi:hypothetical protein